MRKYALAIAITVAATCAAAQEVDNYPSRDVTIVVPFAAGGGVDSVARPVAEGLRKQLKKSFIVENRAGAAGNLGTQQVARAEPDGQTILVNLDIIAAYPYLYKLTYDPGRDLSAVGYIASAPMVLAVHPSLPVNSVADLVALAKTQSEKLTFAIPGLGTPHHLAFELLAHQAGIKVASVSYRGGGPALTDVLGGHVKIGVFTIGTVTSFIESGKLKALAVTGGKRARVAPNIPTIAEAGYPLAQVVNQYVMMVPARTSPSILAKLNMALSQALKDPEVVSVFEQQGFEILHTTSAEAAKTFEDERNRWEAVLKDIKIKLE